MFVNNLYFYYYVVYYYVVFEEYKTDVDADIQMYIKDNNNARDLLSLYVKVNTLQ